MDIQQAVKELKDDSCIVDTLHRAVAQHECLGCGKCVFGYEGGTQLQMMLRDMTEKKSHSDDMQRMEILCKQMKYQSLCEEGSELADAVLFALDQYRDDFVSHQNKKGCRAGVCKKFVTYHILADKCTGCGDCIDECDEDAIIGKKRFIHVIVQDECTQCGDCLDACDDDAIVTAGAVKPRCPQKPIPCKR